MKTHEAPTDDIGRQIVLATREEMKTQWIPQALQALRTNDAVQVLRGMTWLRKILSSEKDPCIDLVVEQNGVEAALFFLRHPESASELRFECAWVLTNISSGASCHTETVIQHGFLSTALDVLREFVSTSPTAPPKPTAPSTRLIGQLAWAVGNISGDGLSIRCTLLRAGWVDMLLQRLERMAAAATITSSSSSTASSSPMSDDDQEAWASLIWSLSNLHRERHKSLESVPLDLTSLTRITRVLHRTLTFASARLSPPSSPSPKSAQVAVAASACMVANNFNSVTNTSTDVSANIDMLQDAAWMLSYLTTHMSDDILDRVATACVHTKLIGQCVNFLSQIQFRTLHAPLLRFIGNLCSGSAHATQICLDVGLAAMLQNLLSSTGPDASATSIRKEAYWIVSNLAAGSDIQIQLLFDHGILRCVADRWAHETQLPVQREMLFIWDNVLENCTRSQCCTFLGDFFTTVIQACTSLVQCPDANILLRVLSIVRTILTRDAEELSGRFRVRARLEEEEDQLLDGLEQMQMHENEEIYEIAQKLLSDYFTDQEDDIVEVQVTAAPALVFNFSNQAYALQPPLPQPQSASTESTMSMIL